MCNPFISFYVYMFGSLHLGVEKTRVNWNSESLLCTQQRKGGACVDSTAALCYKSSIDLGCCSQSNTFQLWNPLTLIVQNLVIYKLFPHFRVFSCPKRIYRVSDMSIASIPP